MEKCGYRSVIACSARRYFWAIEVNLTTPVSAVLGDEVKPGDARNPTSTMFERDAKNPGFSSPCPPRCMLFTPWEDLN